MNKTLQLFVGINNYIVERLVDIGALMSMLVIATVKELGIMQLVIGSESYKTASCVVTQTLGRTEGLPIWIGETNYNMVFMGVDTNNYNVYWDLIS
jgi:hypothetical protein